MATEKKKDEGTPLSGGTSKDNQSASISGSKYKRSKEGVSFPASSSSLIKSTKSAKAKKYKAPRSTKAADATVHKAKKDHVRASKSKTLKKKCKQTEKPTTSTREASPLSSAASSPSLTASRAPCTGDVTARTGVTRSPKILPETTPSANHPEADAMDLQTRMALAEWQQQKAPALGGLSRVGDHVPHSTSRAAAASSARTQDTKELLALAAVADADCGSMQHLLAARAAAMAGGVFRPSEMVEHEMALAAAAANRNHMEHLLAKEIALQHKVRMEQELMAAAHQQQAHHQAQSVHNMAVNALVSGVSVEEVMVRSGLPRDLALEVARRMIALSQASAGGVSQNGHALSAATAARHWAAAEAQNDSLTMAMIREQAILQQQQLQNAAFRLRGGALP